MKNLLADKRVLSVIGFSFLFAYLLSFLFEGQVLHGLLGQHGVGSSGYVLGAIVAHFAGLVSCGYLVKSPRTVRYALLSSVVVCLAATIPFFFTPSVLWAAGLVVGGYVTGCAVALWGYYLKVFTPREERIKSCADVLIGSNIVMIAVNVIAVNRSSAVGLLLAMLCMVIGLAFLWILPVDGKNECSRAVESGPWEDVRKPLLLLCLFIFIITINSGLMYEVINPAFAHLTGLVSWYWAVPYIAALAVMRSLLIRANRAGVLYVGMAMIVGAFVSFMLLGRGTPDYLVVDTLMLGACGIFDLFWWSILAEMLDFTRNPARVFGMGLAANVLGVLCGGALGMAVTSVGLAGSEVAVIALTVVCVTLVILPPLNRQLVMLLKNHAYLAAYEGMSATEQTDIIRRVEALEALTAREEEVLQHILSGQSNREIAQGLFISENTVKTHVRNIFSKYDVGSRAELISILLKNQSAS